MAASYFLLLAQKKVTKEKGTLGFAPSPLARVRSGRTGFAHRPSMACCRNRRDPSRRPRAVHAAGPSTLRRCSEGTRRARAKESKETDVSHISDASAAGTAALCSSRVPSRPRQGLGGKAAKRWPAGCRPLRREHMDVLPAKPSESLRGCLFFGDIILYVPKWGTIRRACLSRGVTFCAARYRHRYFSWRRRLPRACGPETHARSPRRSSCRR
jgi:hypothetical protein